MMTIAEIFTHPYYDYETQDNDFAILELSGE